MGDVAGFSVLPTQPFSNVFSRKARMKRFYNGVLIMGADPMMRKF